MSAVYHYDLYCQTTKTCPWRRLGLPDKEEAIELGKQHATDAHPTKDEWRLRVVTIRSRPSKKVDILKELAK